MFIYIFYLLLLNVRPQSHSRPNLVVIKQAFVLQYCKLIKLYITPIIQKEKQNRINTFNQKKINTEAFTFIDLVDSFHITLFV